MTVHSNIDQAMIDRGTPEKTSVQSVSLQRVEDGTQV